VITQIRILDDATDIELMPGFDGEQCNLCLQECGDHTEFLDGSLGAYSMLGRGEYAQKQNSES
jgi:hypothetical protein